MASEEGVYGNRWVGEGGNFVYTKVIKKKKKKKPKRKSEKLAVGKKK